MGKRLELYDYPRRLELSLELLKTHTEVGNENIDDIMAFAKIRLAKKIIEMGLEKNLEEL